ncbi:sulfite exporter TauE/SafE family protein [Archaeoglobus veneficus]|uniref:Probable membrane transporter protein n=1 Tax=Archaeoglobus veneficus (strain DSM 11195 / SNP6) TaxID=693661 RepID=F2KRY2_ARCVS|nr:sulfite exporter TauE/SafE family protein [Archaeoglobus veneficus]AEA46823.1 protein of unknown function DUF81 [Archaeoglobus veneficus SNP6]
MELLALPVVSFVISIFTSQAGVSGAFLLLPFQMSVLNFTSPAVSATNLLYNIAAIPGGVYRYAREGRLNIYLAAVIIAGTLPGVFLGALIRITYLPDPKTFKLFVGCVLFYLALRLLISAGKDKTGRSEGATGVTEVKYKKISAKELIYEFMGREFRVSIPALLALSFTIGIVGGIYGIGGGAIIAPFLVTVFGLPVYTVAGATLLGTLSTSIFGVLFYCYLGYPPKWIIGLLLGIGGFAGMYAGARLQKHMPEKIIKSVLGVLILFLAAKYVIPYFL